MKREKKYLGLVMVLALFGCETEGVYDYSIRTNDIKIETLKNGIAIHRVDEDVIYYLDGDLKDSKFASLFTPEKGEKIIWQEPGPQAENPTQLFVLTAPIDQRNTKLDERLYRITTDNKAPTKYEVGSQFDKIAFDPEDQFAILYHGEKNTSSGLYNPNEIALVDLEAAPSKSNPKILSVSMDGRKIDMVNFISGLKIGGSERKLAVFIAGSISRILDLSDPENIWVKVPLLPTSSNIDFSAQEIIAVDEEEDCENASCEAKLFIRSANTQDIYYISMGRDPEGFQGVQTKQLEAGGLPLDMEIVKDGDNLLLAVLSRSGNNSKINFVDIDTSAAFNIVISDYLETIRLINDGINEKLVFWGNSSYSVYFLKLENIVKEKGRNLTNQIIQGGINLARELENDRLLIVPRNEDLVLLDLATQKASMLSSGGTYDWQAARIYKDVFYVLPQNADRVDYFNLVTGRPDTLILDDKSISMHIIGGRNTGLIWHSIPTGRVTLFPLDAPSRANAQVLDGLWLVDSLNVKGEN